MSDAIRDSLSPLWDDPLFLDDEELLQAVENNSPETSASPPDPGAGKASTAPPPTPSAELATAIVGGTGHNTAKANGVASTTAMIFSRLLLVLRYH